MSVILVLITLSMLVAGGFLCAFIWAIKNGQYEDTFSPSVRILFDSNKEGDVKANPKKKNNQTSKNKPLKTK